MNIWGRMLRLFGWRLDITAKWRKKALICVAPHTSNRDFILGLLAYKSLGREANFLMKEFWFFFPMKYLLKSLGGIPVPKKGSGGSLTQSLIDMIGNEDYINLAVTPEGTRSARADWRKGFLYIAYGTGIPIQLGVIDYSCKRIIIRDEFTPTGDIDKDMKLVKDYYAKYHDAARYPDKFTL